MRPRRNPMYMEMYMELGPLDRKAVHHAFEELPPRTRLPLSLTRETSPRMRAVTRAGVPDGGGPAGRKQVHRFDSQGPIDGPHPQLVAPHCPRANR